MSLFDQSTRLLVRAWKEPVPAPSFCPTSLYVEYCWLPVVGPSATWLYRHLGQLVQSNPDGGLVDLDELASDHGLGRSTSRHGPLLRSIGRMERFGLAKREDDILFVRPQAPAIPADQLARLSPRLQITEAHLREHGEPKR